MLYDKKWDTPVKITPALEPWQQVLLEAAHYIREHGWVRDSYEDCFTGKVCLMGAIGKEVTLEHRLGASTAVRRYLGGAPERWNDSRGRTKEEVIALLEEVALKGE